MKKANKVGAVKAASEAADVASGVASKLTAEIVSAFHDAATGAIVARIGVKQAAIDALVACGCVRGKTASADTLARYKAARPVLLASFGEGEKDAWNVASATLSKVMRDEFGKPATKKAAGKDKDKDSVDKGTLVPVNAVGVDVENGSIATELRKAVSYIAGQFGDMKDPVYRRKVRLVLETVIVELK